MKAFSIKSHQKITIHNNAINHHKKKSRSFETSWKEFHAKVCRKLTKIQQHDQQQQQQLEQQQQQEGEGVYHTTTTTTTSFESYYPDTIQEGHLHSILTSLTTLITANSNASLDKKDSTYNISTTKSSKKAVLQAQHKQYALEHGAMELLVATAYQWLLVLDKTFRQFSHHYCQEILNKLRQILLAIQTWVVPQNSTSLEGVMAPNSTSNNAARSQCLGLGVLNLLQKVLLFLQLQFDSQQEWEFDMEDLWTTLAAICVNHNLNALIACILFGGYNQAFQSLTSTSSSLTSSSSTTQSQSIVYLQRLFDVVRQEQQGILTECHNHEPILAKVLTEIESFRMQARKLLFESQMQTQDYITYAEQQQKLQQLWTQALTFAVPFAKHTDLLDELLLECYMGRSHLWLQQKQYQASLEDLHACHDLLTKLDPPPPGQEQPQKQLLVTIWTRRATALAGLGQYEPAQQACVEALWQQIDIYNHQLENENQSDDNSSENTEEIKDNKTPDIAVGTLVQTLLGLGTVQEVRPLSPTNTANSDGVGFITKIELEPFFPGRQPATAFVQPDFFTVIQKPSTNGCATAVTARH